MSGKSSPISRLHIISTVVNLTPDQVTYALQDKSSSELLTMFQLAIYHCDNKVIKKLLSEGIVNGLNEEDYAIAQLWVRSVVNEEVIVPHRVYVILSSIADEYF